MKKWFKLGILTCAVMVALSVMFFAFSPVLVGAWSGGDNAAAYSEALQASAAALQETLSQMSQGMVNAMDKTLAHQFKLFEKAVSP